MTEKKILIDRKPVIYEGIFRMDELWGILSRFIKSRGMFIIEMRNEEKVLPNGKNVFIEIAPYRKLSDYLKKIIEIELHAQRVRDVVVTVDGRKQKYQHGEVEIKFSAIMESDWRSRWEGTGFYFLLRTLIDKFVRYDIIRQAENETVKECLDLQDEVKAYLNMSRFKLVDEHAQEARLREGID
jgi:hypothetical protein